MGTVRLTTAQALVRHLASQRSVLGGETLPLFAGVWAIFGHGNVAGIGQALQQNPDFPYIPVRNEQSGVHLASAFAKASNRLRTYACTSSIGPGATNMITGAALATINRLPVLLLPGDTFASRAPHPVLQQLEAPHDGTMSVNDCFRPVTRYFDRITRPEQLVDAALAAMRVLTDPAETGAVCLALPEDVQTEVKSDLEALKATLENSESTGEELQAGISRLGESSQKMGAAMYAAAEAESAAAGGATGSTGEGDDDVVDAEIVDEGPATGSEDEAK